MSFMDPELCNFAILCLRKSLANTCQVFPRSENNSQRGAELNMKNSREIQKNFLTQNARVYCFVFCFFLFFLCDSFFSKRDRVGLLPQRVRENDE